MREYSSTFFDLAHQVKHFRHVSSHVKLNENQVEHRCNSHLVKGIVEYVTDVQHWFAAYT
jgi:hypothetical protein